MVQEKPFHEAFQVPAAVKPLLNIFRSIKVIFSKNLFMELSKCKPIHGAFQVSLIKKNHIKYSLKEKVRFLIKLIYGTL